MTNGLFVVLEGVDGAGKTEMAKRLADHVEGLGYEVVLVREPGGTIVGEEIRTILRGHDLYETTKLLLFYAARNELLRTVVRPALKRGAVVICDRFSDSSYVYQVALGEADDYLFNELESAVVGDGGDIDLKILLDIGFKTYKDRKAELDRLDLKDVTDFNYARATYHGLTRQSPDWWLVVAAEQPRDEVFEDLRAVVENLLPEKADAGRV